MNPIFYLSGVISHSFILTYKSQEHRKINPNKINKDKSKRNAPEFLLHWLQPLSFGLLFYQVAYDFVTQVHHLSLNLQLIPQTIDQVVIEKTYVFKPILFEFRRLLNILIEEPQDLGECLIAGEVLLCFLAFG